MQSMINRIVLFQFKPEIEDVEIEASIAQAIAWQGEIPELKQLVVAKNRMGRDNQAYYLSLVMTFVDQYNLDTFSAHPAHVAFVDRITQQTSNILVFDYEK